MRVNVEEKFFGSRKLNKLQRLMGWSRNETIGALVSLWHESQSSFRVEGTAEEIAEWAWYDGAEPDGLVDALASVGFIKEVDGLTYRISGNEVQIGNVIKRLEAARKGGKATKQKWSGVKFETSRLKSIQNKQIQEVPRPDGLANGLANGVANSVPIQSNTKHHKKSTQLLPYSTCKKSIKTASA